MPAFHTSTTKVGIVQLVTKEQESSPRFLINYFDGGDVLLYWINNDNKGVQQVLTRIVIDVTVSEEIAAFDGMDFKHFASYLNIIVANE